MASTSGKYLYSVARPMPVCSAICDIVTDSNPCSATSAAVVSRIASRTSRRCASIVSVHSFGTNISIRDDPTATDRRIRYTVFGKVHDRHILRPIRVTTRKTRMGDPSADRNTDVEPDGESRAGMPRWVKVFGVIALLVVVLFVILLLTGGPGRHGPGRHTGGLGA